MTLKNQVQQYQQKYGLELKYFKGWGLIPNWEFNLLMDLKVIKLKHKILRILSPKIYQNYQQGKEKSEKFQEMTKNNAPV